MQIYAEIGMDNFSLEYKSFGVGKGWVELTVPALCKVGIHCLLSGQYNSIFLGDPNTCQ